ncbi:MFS general substrate transporter [Gonapodya prolifera JEL478]|uniref:MFS general substrate transporter n=1 Tax=Gonapodya prolifera (strain JEL478) TaxID=1344416 RepID=A0A139AKY6_GONPJ|nr:MFS general substrate transporter [Gonapodya prolifera JEL478]|eukprot:KXS17358.1 MFS general substrate transporter [Gonapodya prolifera JEL478]
MRGIAPTCFAIWIALGSDVGMWRSQGYPLPIVATHPAARIARPPATPHPPPSHPSALPGGAMAQRQYIQVEKFTEAAQVLPDWTPSEENRVMRKVDLALIPWLMICYTALNIDRNNISAAVIMNAETPTHSLLVQLGLDGNKFNWALSGFFFGYVLLEIPSNLLITRFNPSRWIARIMTSWGILAACMGAVQNFAGLVVVRALVGCMEAGYSPGTALYLSFWYKKYEVSSRWAYMFGGANVISSFGGVVAFGVAGMDGLGGISGWRWLFILEGAASGILGIATWFILPDYPQTCRFLDTREKEIVIGRLPPTGPSVVSKQIVPAEVLDAFKDWKMYALSFSLMLTLITVYGIAYFAPSVIKSMGFTSNDAQLLSVPTALFSAIWIIFINWSSDRSQEKLFHGIACLAPAVVGYLFAGDDPEPDWRLCEIWTALFGFVRYWNYSNHYRSEHHLHKGNLANCCPVRLHRGVRKHWRSHRRPNLPTPRRAPVPARALDQRHIARGRAHPVHHWRHCHREGGRVRGQEGEHDCV